MRLACHGTTTSYPSIGRVRCGFQMGEIKTTARTTERSASIEFDGLDSSMSQHCDVPLVDKFYFKLEPNFIPAKPRISTKFRESLYIFVPLFSHTRYTHDITKRLWRPCSEGVYPENWIRFCLSTSGEQCDESTNREFESTSGSHPPCRRKTWHGVTPPDRNPRLGWGTVS